MATRRAHRYFGWLLAIVFLAIGIERALRTLGMALGPDLPVLLFASFFCQAVGALVAAACLFAGSRLALFGLALFAAGVLVQLGADVLVYHVRALLEALGLALLALALTALGWLALERPDRNRLELPT